MKKIFRILSFFMYVSGFAQTIPNHINAYVNDFANVMNDSERTVLEDKLRSLEQQTSIELAIVTVSSLDGSDIETYSNKLFKQWGIGKKGLNNGLLVLTSINDHKWRIEVGYGIEDWMTDLDSRRLGSGSIPLNFRLGKYFQGLNFLTDNIIAKLGPESWEQRNAYLKQQEKNRQEAQSEFIDIMIWIGATILFGALMVFVYFQAKRRADKIKEEKEKREREIKAIAEWIAKVISKFNFSIDALDKLEKDWNTQHYKFKGASLLLQKFRDADPKIKDLCKQTVDTLESMNTQKVLLGTITNGIFNEVDALFAMAYQITEIEKFSKDGANRSIIRISLKLKEAGENYKTCIEKYGLDVWSYNFAFDFDRKSGFEILDRAQELAQSCRGITADDYDKKEKDYNASLENLKSVENQISLVNSRIEQIESASNYVEKSKAGTLRVMLNEMESYRSNSDVSATTRQKMDRAKDDTQRMINSNFKNPLQAYSNISACIGAMEDAIKRAKNDIEEEEEREAALAATAAVYSSSSSSSSSDDGPSFGGFGGGDSGGGGASGDW